MWEGHLCVVVSSLRKVIQPSGHPWMFPLFVSTTVLFTRTTNIGDITITIRVPFPAQAKPVRDSPELFAACFRCGGSNPLLSPFTNMSSLSASISSASASCAQQGAPPALSTSNRGRFDTPLPWGDACTTCRHPFVRSFFNFESLPLVEFQPAPGCVTS